MQSPFTQVSAPSQSVLFWQSAAEAQHIGMKVLWQPLTGSQVSSAQMAPLAQLGGVPATQPATRSQVSWPLQTLPSSQSWGPGAQARSVQPALVRQLPLWTSVLGPEGAGLDAVAGHAVVAIRVRLAVRERIAPGARAGAVLLALVWLEAEAQDEVLHGYPPGAVRDAGDAKDGKDADQGHTGEVRHLHAWALERLSGLHHVDGRPGLAVGVQDVAGGRTAREHEARVDAPLIPRGIGRAEAPVEGLGQ